MYFDLTTSAQIQAILTVDDVDLPIEVIDAQNLDDDLAEALEVILDWRQFDAASTNSRRLRLFAKYFCAGTIAGMAQVFVLKKDSDGSNESQRSDKDGWAFMSATLLAKAKGYLDLIIEDLNPTTPGVAPYVVFSRVEPDRDPIITPRASNAT